MRRCISVPPKKTNTLTITEWERFLPDASRSICSFLCTDANANPHERSLRYNRTSISGGYLTNCHDVPGSNSLMRNVRLLKYKPGVHKIELIYSGPKNKLVPLQVRSGKQFLLTVLAPKYSHLDLMIYLSPRESKMKHHKTRPNLSTRKEIINTLPVAQHQSTADEQWIRRYHIHSRVV